jgi:DNA-binding transcriptional MerR regulator
MPSGRAEAKVRIGELSRRLGVSDHVLRAWERRYGVLRPARSPGGYRLYSQSDEIRLRRMQAHLARGMSAAEAARAALSEAPDQARQEEGGALSHGLAATAHALAQSLDDLDEPSAQAVLDRLLADFTVETVLREVVMPYLHDLGERWAQGRTTVWGEHFASNLLRGRLASLARGWGDGHGPRAILACAPGEQHDIGLMAFGLVLHRSGWRVNYIGADTPIRDFAHAVLESCPDLAVLVAVAPGRFHGLTADLSRLAAAVPLALAGAGATQTLARDTGARLLTGDPVTEAQWMREPGSYRP